MQAAVLYERITSVGVDASPRTDCTCMLDFSRLSAEQFSRFKSLVDRMTVPPEFQVAHVPAKGFSHYELTRK
jgi:hypothetical protein